MEIHPHGRRCDNAHLVVVPMLRPNVQGTRSSILELLRVRAGHHRVNRVSPIAAQRVGKNIYLCVDDDDPAYLSTLTTRLHRQLLRYFPSVGSAWIGPSPNTSFGQAIGDHHLRNTALLAAANISARWAAPGGDAIRMLTTYLSAGPQITQCEDLARVLNVMPCSHGTSLLDTGGPLVRPLSHLPLFLAAHESARGYLAMSDVFSYGNGFNSPELVLPSQLAPIRAIAGDILNPVEAKDELSLLAILERVAQIRHLQQEDLRGHIDGLHRAIIEVGGETFETSGDGVVAWLPDREAVDSIRKRCAVRQRVGIAGLGAVALDGPTLGLREVSTRLDFITGLAKISLAAPELAQTAPNIYGEPWPSALLDTFWEHAEAMPAKSRAWLRSWLTQRPLDWADLDWAGHSTASRFLITS